MDRTRHSRSTFVESTDHLSVDTVHGYAKVIFKHFGVHSQTQLVTRFSKGDA